MSEPHTNPQEPETPTHKRPLKSLPKQWLFFGVLGLVFVVAYCLVNVDSFTSLLARIGDVVTPILIGCVLAYFLNPILKFWEYIVFRKMGKGNLRLGLSLLCTYLTAIAILAGIVALIIPELVKSIGELISNYEVYLNRLLTFVQTIIDKFNLDVDVSDMEKLTALLTNLFGNTENLMNTVLDSLKSVVLDTNLISNIWAFLSSLFGTLIDVVLGVFISVYILSSKEKRVAQFRKFRAAYMTDKQGGFLNEFITLADKIFGSFFKGVILDAAIVGVLVFIVMSIFRVSEYTLLIAAICAVTNVIPVFGPWLGAIPSALIVLMTNPEKVILFIILILIIQQIDANLILPTIQGNNTGISSLSVLISITVMGGLFGIPGMVIGVPVFAVIIEMIKRTVDRKLISQNKETDTTFYYRKNAIGNAEEEVYYEHAHWKYKWDHSRIKPRVEKILAAFARKSKRKLKKLVSKAANTPAETAPAETVSELEVPASETFAEEILAEDTPADMVADGADKE